MKRLELLLGLLSKTAIREAVGGDEAVAAALESEVRERIAAITAGREQKAGPRGAPSETEYLDSSTLQRTDAMCTRARA